MQENTKEKNVTVWSILRQILSRKEPYFEHIQRPTLPEDVDARSRSTFIRHLDCGSCNACEMELNALSNPVYDVEQYGIRFEASPRHADFLAMTGPFTRNLEEAALLTLEAMPQPRIIVIGDCAIDKGPFRDSYAVKDCPQEVEDAIKAQVPGCPPTPEDILRALLALPPMHSD